MEYEFKVVKLHDVPNLIEEAARLMNSEWPRSLEARCHVIRNSSDDLPCSFLLLKVTTDTNAVVGHSRLTKVLQKPKSVLVESVIVDKALRGCGLGKMIMRHSEEFALKHGYEMMHLSTHDKQSFYEHLGYSLSTPVSPVTKVARFLPQSQIKKADDSILCEKGINSTMKNESDSESDSQTRKIKQPSQFVVPQTTLVLSTLPPPPPPPIPSTMRHISPSFVKNIERGSKVNIWMRKHLYGPNNPL